MSAVVRRGRPLPKQRQGGPNPRACEHHVDCKLELNEDNVCFRFSIQGDEDGDVLHVPDSLDVTYVLQAIPPFLE